MSEHRNGSTRGRRRKRSLSAEEKLQIWQQLLTGELSQRQAAEQAQARRGTVLVRAAPGHRPTPA